MPFAICFQRIANYAYHLPETRTINVKYALPFPTADTWAPGWLDPSDRPQVRLPKLGTSVEPALGMSENVRTLFQTCQFFDVCLVVKEHQRFAVYFSIVSFNGDGVCVTISEGVKSTP